MTIVTDSISHSSKPIRRPAVSLLLVPLFWLAAALLVIASHRVLGPSSPAAGAIVAIGIILGVAGCYSRFCARSAGVAHALGVGIVWLVLSIGVEVVLATRLGHGWFSLLGSPDHPLLRNVVLFVWIFAPALFAHRKDLP